MKCRSSRAPDPPIGHALIHPWTIPYQPAYHSLGHSRIIPLRVEYSVFDDYS